MIKDHINVSFVIQNFWVPSLKEGRPFRKMEDGMNEGRPFRKVGDCMKEGRPFRKDNEVTGHGFTLAGYLLKS